MSQSVDPPASDETGTTGEPGGPTGEASGVTGWRLLRTHAPFRALFAARTVSFTGEALALVVLMLFVVDSVGQALAVSVLLLVGDLAPAALGPVTGVVSDRFDLKRVMVGCELVQGAVLLVIALLLPPLVPLLVLVGLRAVTGQVFLPASRAAVPALVPRRGLESANAAVGFGTNGAEAAGPLLAAALVPWLGIRGVLVVAALSFLASALLLQLRLPAMAPAPPESGQRGGVLADARAGLGYIWRARPVRVIVFGFCAVVACNGIDDVALVLLAKETFRAGDAAVGLLLAAVGIGLVAGYALLAHLGRRAAMPVLLLVGFAVSSAGNLLTGLAWAVAAAFAVQAVRGLGIAAMDVAANTLLQRLVPAGMRGRVFGNFYGAIGIAAGVSYLAGGLLLDVTSAPTTLVIAGGGGLLITAITLALLAGRRRPGSRHSQVR